MEDAEGVVNFLVRAADYATDEKWDDVATVKLPKSPDEGTPFTLGGGVLESRNYFGLGHIGPYKGSGPNGFGTDVSRYSGTGVNRRYRDCH